MMLLLLFLLLPWTPTVNACGGFFCEPNTPIEQTGEAIAFGVTGNRVDMHVQILYEGPAERFSWLLPVPHQPTINVGSDILFQQLFEQTLPQFTLTVQEPEQGEVEAECVVDPTCLPVAFGENESAGGPSAIIIDKGSVGPFDYVILEAGEGDPGTIIQWLADNEYDEYQGSAALINYYTRLDHKFVAVRLQKNADSGEIQPLILSQEMPQQPDPLTTAMACIPIKLTSVAATNEMPIHVYILGESRAEPINWLEVVLDEKLVDWLGCQNSQSCYYADLRRRFAAASQRAAQQTFLTEYAGSTDFMENTIELSSRLYE